MSTPYLGDMANRRTTRKEDTAMTTWKKVVMGAVGALTIGTGANLVGMAIAAPTASSAVVDVKGNCDEAEHANDAACQGAQIPEDNDNDAREAEPGDDRGRENEANDDRGQDENEANDDRGGNSGPSENSGPSGNDDSGNSGPGGDDRGGNSGSGHGSDDGAGHDAGDDHGSDD
jgi:hypothetical protein